MAALTLLLSLVVVSGDHSSLWSRLLSWVASGVAEHGLYGEALSSCPGSMWDLPTSGMEPVFPALAGRPTRKVPVFAFLNWVL